MTKLYGIMTGNNHFGVINYIEGHTGHAIAWNIAYNSITDPDPVVVIDADDFDRSMRVYYKNERTVFDYSDYKTREEGSRRARWQPEGLQQLCVDVVDWLTRRIDADQGPAAGSPKPGAST